MIHWFGYLKKRNEITFWSVNFNLAVPFLRGRDFCIEELSSVKENKEVNIYGQMKSLNGSPLIIIKRLVAFSKRMTLNQFIVQK